jgi:hypothetical protein
MLRRFLPGLAASLAAALLLIACGDPSSESANQATNEDYEQTATADPDSTSEKEQYEGTDLDEEGGESESSYEESDRSEGYPAERARTASRQAPVYAQPRRPVPRQTATPAVGAGVRGDVGMFYEALDRDGTWVKHPDYDYVWLPARMGPGWRPYQEGRWIWTEQYGWYWESEEPSAWAVYHYGRWDYDPDYGWFWVPGDTWAPAWVTWRTGGEEIGWAPIAPDRRGFAAGQPRRYAPPVAESWVFVETPHFSEPDLSPFVRPVNRIAASLGIAREVRTPRWERDRMVNYGVPPSELRRYLRQPIPSRELVYVGDRDDMFEDVRGRRIGIYRPTIMRAESRRAPRRIEDAKDVARVILAAFAEPAPERLYDAPSAALLDVLAREERRRLVEARLDAEHAALDDEIERLRKERAELIEKRRQQAKKLEAKLERERDEARAERKQLQEQIRAEKRERAEEITIEAAAPVAPPAAPAPAADPGAASAPMPAQAPSESVTAPAAPVETPPADVGARGDESDTPRKKRDRAREDRQEPAPAAAVEPKPMPVEPAPAESITKPVPEEPAPETIAKPEPEQPAPEAVAKPAAPASEPPAQQSEVTPELPPAEQAPPAAAAPPPAAAPPAEEAPAAPPEEAKDDEGQNKPSRRARKNDDADGDGEGKDRGGKRKKARGQDENEPAPSPEADAPQEAVQPPPAEGGEVGQQPAPPAPDAVGPQGALDQAPPEENSAAGEPDKPGKKRKAKKRLQDNEDAPESAEQQPAEAPGPPADDAPQEVPPQ